MTATVVLVHGAWHGGWCWDRVVPELEARGVPVVAPDLPGHAKDERPLSDLHGDADSVKAALDGIDGPVVLLGHSYGGAVITDAGSHPSVGHLVYLCALMLGPGETCGTSLPAELEALSEAGPDLGSAMVISEDGATCSIPADGAAAFLYNHSDPETVAWCVERLTPQPLATFVQEPRAVAWQDTPSTYVVCADDRAIPPSLQRRFAAARATHTVEWDADHSPFLDMPVKVADLLAGLAASL